MKRIRFDYIQAWTLLLFLLALLISSPSFAAFKVKHSNLTKIEKEYQRIHKALQEKGSEAETIEELDNPPLLNRLWRQVTSWVVTYLNTYPRTKAQHLERSLARLGLQASILSFEYEGTKGFAVAVSDDVAGTFFVVTRKHGKPFAHVWSMTPTTLLRLPHGGNWMRSAQDGRPGVHPSLQGLPATAKSHPRFYLHSYYSGANGSTIARQIIVWEWDGREALPLLADDYYLPVDSKRTEIAFKDNLLSIATKEHAKTFFTTGPEEEPEGLWSIRIGPDRVEDLGRRYVIPELHFLDQLLYRIQRRQTVADMASPAVNSKLTAVISSVAPETDYKPVGEMWGWRRIPIEQGFWVCLDVDEPGPFEYKIVYQSGKPYVTEIRDALEPTSLRGLSYDKSTSNFDTSKCR